MRNNVTVHIKIMDAFELVCKRQSWHLRIALVPPMNWGLSATGEVRAASGIFA